MWSDYWTSPLCRRHRPLAIGLDLCRRPTPSAQIITRRQQMALSHTLTNHLCRRPDRRHTSATRQPLGAPGSRVCRRSGRRHTFTMWQVLVSPGYGYRSVLYFYLLCFLSFHPFDSIQKHKMRQYAYIHRNMTDHHQVHHLKILKIIIII